MTTGDIEMWGMGVTWRATAHRSQQGEEIDLSIQAPSTKYTRQQSAHLVLTRQEAREIAAGLLAQAAWLDQTDACA